MDSKAVVPQRQSEVLPNYDILDLEGLTPNEAKFVSAYVRHGNSTKAYDEIFPNTEDPAKFGRALAKTRKVNVAITKQLSDIVVREAGSKNAILAETVRNGTYDIRDLYDEDGNELPLSDIPESLARSISGIEIERGPNGEVTKRKLSFANKTSAQNLLYKHMDLFNDKGNSDDAKVVNNYFIKSKIDNLNTESRKIIAEQCIVTDPTDPVKTRSFGDFDFSDIDAVDGEVVDAE